MQRKRRSSVTNPIRSKDNFLVFGAPLIEQEEIREVVATLESGWIGTGPKVARFEDDFKRYKKASHAVAVNSCTAALHLSLQSIDLNPGDEVITTPMTFCASVNAIIHAGAVPVLADVDPVTMNIDPERIREKISDKTRALLVVHFAGRPCDMDHIGTIVEKHQLKLIEDCAHAIESEYRGIPVGIFGDFGCFSFYVTKNIITGEGGMVLARDENQAARIKILALHGMSQDAWKRFGDEGYRHYYVVESGYKYNMMDIQAAMGIHQLKRIDAYGEKRKRIWNTYNDAFRNLPVGLPPDPEPHTRHAFHLYTIRIKEKECGMSRDEFLIRMTKENIGVGVHYLSIPEHPYYQKRFGWQPEHFPAAMQIGRETVSLPLSPKLTERDTDDVIHAVTSILES